ncbi:Malate dehydrogenase [Arachis hypogaea]|nr:Malate dehydrogenase [Arachis hypogaea]
MPFLIAFLALSPLHAPLSCVVPPSPPYLVPLSLPCIAPSPCLWMLLCGCYIARCTLLRPVCITVLEVASVIVAVALFSAVVVQLETNNEAKDGAGSATLSMAYAAARFVELSFRALDGYGDMYDYSLVQSNLTDLSFFTSRVKLGGKQVEALIPSDLQGLTEYEQKVLEALKPKLKAGIEKGIGFSHKQMVAT